MDVGNSHRLPPFYGPEQVPFLDFLQSNGALIETFR